MGVAGNYIQETKRTSEGQVASYNLLGHFVQFTPSGDVMLDPELNTRATDQQTHPDIYQQEGGEWVACYTDVPQEQGNACLKKVFTLWDERAAKKKQALRKPLDTSGPQPYAQPPR